MLTEDNITELLGKWQSGNQEALGELGAYIHTELHKQANRYMGQERKAHTLQATALVNEAFIELANANIDYQDRQHFYRLAGQL